jgi:uncharacterized membrane protein
MGKAEYLKQLSHRLRGLPESERQDALEYYDGYIADAESEEAAIKQLGTPGETAANILANYVTGNTTACAAGNSTSSPHTPEAGLPQREKAGFSGIKTALMVILAFFALPAGLPLIIGVAAVAFALFAVLAVLVFSFAVAGFALLAGGVAGLIAFPFVLWQDLGFALLTGGFGLFALGAGILIVKNISVPMRGFPMIARFVANKIRGRVQATAEGGHTNGRE